MFIDDEDDDVVQIQGVELSSFEVESSEETGGGHGSNDNDDDWTVPLPRFEN